MRLRRSFFTADPVTLARALLGQRLVHILDDGTRLAGLIVETEAYLGIPDMAAHSHRRRRTARTEPMYLVGGTSYVYFTYGMHHCFNIVAGRAEDPVAVLIRALEPTEGVEHMANLRADARRGKAAIDGVARLDPHTLCRGPANLCRAMAIDLTLNALDLSTDARLFLEHAAPHFPARSIARSPRVGIDYAGAWAKRLLRFYLRNHPAVSGRPPSRPARFPSRRPGAGKST